jgi:predicted dehydrogenase
MSETLSAPLAASSTSPPPRIGFLGVGWIGRHRMEAMLATGAIEAAAVADPSVDGLDAALALAPSALRLDTLDALLDQDLDGVVIATPSALHPEQAIRALKRGLAVFCQKPLGRSEAEVREVVDVARTADRLLQVDMSYRFTEGMRQIRELVRSGSLGRVFAADLVFHNAYGPDKAWFYDRELSGGGCVMDLGVHLVDLALWVLDFPGVANVTSSLFAAGETLDFRTDQVEDYATAVIELRDGGIVRLACSWRLHIGCDAEISARFHGTQGGAAMRNLGGSFYDFTTERFGGGGRETLSAPPEAWGGRAAAEWARQVSRSPNFDPAAEQLCAVAGLLDRIYGR